MTTCTDTAIPTEPSPAEHRDVGEEIVLLARIGEERMALTARHVLDTVASYFATGGHMPTPTEGEQSDPYEPLHVITEQWLWGNVPGWLLMTSPVQLATYRAQAMQWIRSYFGPNFPHLRW